MAEKDPEVSPVLPQSQGGTMEQSQTHPKNNRRMKCLVYFVAFAVFLIAVILIVALVVMNVKTPTFRVRSASFETFNVGTTRNPYFSLKMMTELGIKNDNVGNYVFQNTTVYFFYDGSPVGNVDVPASKARTRETERFNTVVDLNYSSSSINNNNSNGNSKLAKDLNSGVIMLECESKLKGKVEVMMIILKKEKKKSANMDCTLTIGVPDEAVRHITCK